MNTVTACRSDDADLNCQGALLENKMSTRAASISMALTKQLCVLFFSFLFFSMWDFYSEKHAFRVLFEEIIKKKIGSAIKPNLGSLRARSALLFNTSSNKIANEHPNFVLDGLNDSTEEAENATILYNLCRCDEYRARQLSRLGGCSLVGGNCKSFRNIAYCIRNGQASADALGCFNRTAMLANHPFGIRFGRSPSTVRLKRL